MAEIIVALFIVLGIIWIIGGLVVTSVYFSALRKFSFRLYGESGIFFRKGRTRALLSNIFTQHSDAVSEFNRQMVARRLVVGTLWMLGGFLLLVFLMFALTIVSVSDALGR